MFGRRKIRNLKKEVADLTSKLEKKDFDYSLLKVKLDGKEDYIKEIESQKKILVEQLANISYQLTLSISLNDKLGVDFQDKLQKILDTNIGSAFVSSVVNNELNKIDTADVSVDVPTESSDLFSDNSIEFIDYDTKSNPNRYNRTKLYRLRNGELRLGSDGELYSLYAVNFMADGLFCRAYLYATKDNANQRFLDLLYDYYKKQGRTGCLNGKVEGIFQIRLGAYKESFKNKNFDEILDFSGLNS